MLKWIISSIVILGLLCLYFLMPTKVVSNNVIVDEVNPPANVEPLAIEPVLAKETPPKNSEAKKKIVQSPERPPKETLSKKTASKETVSKEEQWLKLIDDEITETGEISRATAAYVYCQTYYKEPLEQEYCEGFHSREWRWKDRYMINMIRTRAADALWSVDAAIDLDELIAQQPEALKQRYQFGQTQCSDLGCFIPTIIQRRSSPDDLATLRIKIKEIGFEHSQVVLYSRRYSGIYILRYPMHENRFSLFWNNL